MTEADVRRIIQETLHELHEQLRALDERDTSIAAQLKRTNDLAERNIKYSEATFEREIAAKEASADAYQDSVRRDSENRERDVESAIADREHLQSVRTKDLENLLKHREEILACHEAWADCERRVAESVEHAVDAIVRACGKVRP